MPLRFDPATENVKFPGVVAVTVTVLVLALAVAPTAALEVLQALIVAARFVAKVVVLLLATKVPMVEPVHVCVPSLPPLTAPQETLVTVFPTERVEAPSMVEVTVTILPPPVVALVIPTAAPHTLMAAAKFVPATVSVLEFTKVPVNVGLAPEHVFEPPGVTVNVLGPFVIVIA